MLQRIDELLKKNEDFAIETTLATRSYAQTIRKAKGIGYNVTLVYFWLSSPDLAIQRVRNRVAEGGHHIPEEVIRRRYRKGVKNLFQLFIPICDYWLVIDNSQTPYTIVAEGQEDEDLMIQHQVIWDRLRTLSHE